MVGRFYFNNIGIRKHQQGDWVIAEGEISNASGKDFHAVAFRIVLFLKSIPVGNETVIINGFRSGSTRTFEKQIGELCYSAINKDVTSCEIYAESAY